MSKRDDVTKKVEKFVNDNNLNKVYSDTGLSKDKKYRYVLFNIPKYVDGEIRIYNEKFIGVKFQTSFRDMPRNGWFVFKSFDDAMKFVKTAFIDLDMKKVDEICGNYSLLR